MVKYTQEIKDKCVEMIKAGSTFTAVTKELGPNANAVKRYCIAAGMEFVKKAKAPKAE